MALGHEKEKSNQNQPKDMRGVYCVFTVGFAVG